jgi:hypothetical protein
VGGNFHGVRHPDRGWRERVRRDGARLHGQRDEGARPLLFGKMDVR